MVLEKITLKRIRITPPADPLVPAWTMDFDNGHKYRIVRPEAAAEIVSIENENIRFPMRQPDAWELEALQEGCSLTERGGWIIRRETIRASAFYDN